VLKQNDLRKLCLFAMFMGAAAISPWSSRRVHAQDQPAKAPPAGGSLVLPPPTASFHGVIGLKASQSKPDFPKGVSAPAGAPNVLLIMTDDTGFGASSTFGGPIPTPALDRVAKKGLVYNNFHTTALCSPSRAALLTGRNHHSVGFGNISEFATGYPGYNSILPKTAGTIGNILTGNGYNTSWFGKNHLIPDWLQSPDGPFDQWPSALGFEYFYGFLGGDTDNWHPALFENTRAVLPPFHDPNYILIRDMSERAINWIHMQHAIAPSKPFFMYFAPGNGHAPHHATKDWIAKFKGKFDQGWDKQREITFENQKRLGIIPANTVLTPRPKEIPAWDSLTADQKKIYARMMEVYAAAVAQGDHEIGRVLDSLEQSGQLDNTLVIYIEGDNGASAEGTLEGTTNEASGQFETESIAFKLSILDKLGSDQTYNHYPVGWAHAMDTPFQWTKQVASHFGGTANAMAISWPKGIKQQGEMRPQFHHLVDIVPTILETVGIQAPATLNGISQMPMEGISMVYSFGNAKAPTNHNTQYFEIVANRGIYHDNWMASTTPLRLPWVTFGVDPDPDQYPWELYDISQDFSQSKNLASENPQKLSELKSLFLVEAAKYNVLPIDSSFADRANPALRPGFNSGRTAFTYYPGMIRIPEANAPDIKNKSFNVSAEVEIPKSGAQGILATQGGRFAGWSLMILDGKPMFAYAFSNQDGAKYPNQNERKWRIGGSDRLTPSLHTIAFDFTYDGGGIGKGGKGILSVDGKQVAQGRIERTCPFRFSLDESFDVGQDTGTAVIDEYETQMPFTFTGTLRRVDFKLGPDNLTGAQHAFLHRRSNEFALEVQ
jgi:arylsulfatase A-like enzyme